jgi:hypothetical protein
VPRCTCRPAWLMTLCSGMRRGLSPQLSDAHLQLPCTRVLPSNRAPATCRTSCSMSRHGTVKTGLAFAQSGRHPLLVDSAGRPGLWPGSRESRAPQAPCQPQSRSCHCHLVLWCCHRRCEPWIAAALQPVLARNNRFQHRSPLLLQLALSLTIEKLC